MRDLLLEGSPKDFDVATDARPNEIRRLFRNSRIIGRRFRLVHVYFKDGVVEVATFRRNPDPGEQESAQGELLITSDNTFGTPEEDAFRRDFTVNALFYDIADFSVIDYVGGLHDLEEKMIRVIGRPDVRFQEDPVRMLRACEFAARLGFGIGDDTQEGIERQKKELAKASAARLTEEVIELMRCGSTGAAFQWMLDLGLLEVMLPEAMAMVSPSSRRLGDFGRLLPALDSMVAAGKPPSDGVLLATLLLPAVLLARYDKESADGRPMRRSGVETLVRDVIDPFVARFQLSRARHQEVHHALVTFQDLADPKLDEGRRRRLPRRASFGDALSLMKVMVAATGQGEDILEDWQRLAAAESSKGGGRSGPDDDDRSGGRGDRGRGGGRGGRGGKKRRPRRRRRSGKGKKS